MLASPEVREVLNDHFSVGADRFAFSVLSEEMEYYAWRYRAADDALRVELAGAEAQWGPGEGSLASAAPVDDLETIVGSFDKLFDKLPGPLKKVMHVLVELLKLTPVVLV